MEQEYKKDLPNSSKAKSDIVKSMAKNFLKTRKASVTSKVSRKNQKKKTKGVREGSEETEEIAKKLNSNEENQQKDATNTTEHAEKSEPQENTCVPDSQEKSVKPNDSSKKQTRKEEGGISNKNEKCVEKQQGNKKRRRDWQRGNDGNSEKTDKNKEKHHRKESKPENKEDRIDGLIFMCNAKTKPDCFRYRVMGVASSKKDIVLSIRPGLKLFLYDYDLKLMYGIYKASSSGGMKLEPNAFGGAFPAQVRFSVHADCYPLAESIFKKAIKENYYVKNKFKIELNARQVRQLTQIFQPVAVHSTALPVRSPPRAVTRIREHTEIREARDRARESRRPSDRKASARDPFARSYAVLSHERDRKIAHGEFASTRRENSRRDLYLSEKDYRAYGLQGERRDVTYRRDYDEQLLRQTDSVYREPLPMQRDRIHSDRLYLSEREHRTYDLGVRQEMQSTISAATANTSALDPYHVRYHSPSLVESYLPHPRGEISPLNRSYFTYASDALLDHCQIRHLQDVNPEAASVSSRYAFGGPSLSYR